jgi:hypothetical protein
VTPSTPASNQGGIANRQEYQSLACQMASGSTPDDLSTQK